MALFLWQIELATIVKWIHNHCHYIKVFWGKTHKMLNALYDHICVSDSSAHTRFMPQNGKAKREGTEEDKRNDARRSIGTCTYRKSKNRRLCYIQQWGLVMDRNTLTRSRINQLVAVWHNLQFSTNVSFCFTLPELVFTVSVFHFQTKKALSPANLELWPLTMT